MSSTKTMQIIKYFKALQCGNSDISFFSKAIPLEFKMCAGILLQTFEFEPRLAKDIAINY